ncbi:3-keto-disaccharide hydrolase [Marinoscillum furvescens]|uniref:Uncharacterized protein DUF1080 n=1 Tax=Marinoscillum furvescens DSM 4134 TaxID=1122208 RepID=A0A3D9LGB2_MARFU|nr:DUF1080 domain-containing protein [Marinoscillum furvescens]REE05678.1 uncharacterized protein DUF1080 [Marinoscillum furvescens DSM 4134]
MKKLMLSLLAGAAFFANAQDIPQPDWDELNKTKPWEQTELYKKVPVVTPTVDHSAPSDAIVLFDGKNLNAWQKAQYGSPVNMEGFEAMAPLMDPDYKGEAAEWNIVKGALEVNPGTGSIATRQAFGDVQLHIEWRAPKMPADKKGQQGGNSGVIFMGMYEVQVLNSYKNPTYNNGQAASVYKQHIPLANASRPAEEWQVYDIIFMAPKFSDKGTVVSPARVTVFHNDILVQNNVELLGPTCFIGTPYYVAHAEKLPLVLQDHSDKMQFRNIWIREL